MKKIYFTIGCFSLLSLFISQSSFTTAATNNTIKDSLQKPGSLNPFNFDISKPVNARMLRDNVMGWNEAWKNKEVTVVAWVVGGISEEGIYRFSDHNNPGVIVLETILNPIQKESLATHAAETRFVLIKGTIKSKGRFLVLDNCVVTGNIDEPFESKKLNPYNLNETEPVYPVDIIKSMDAWSGVQVIVKDKCNLPAAGNTISFTDAHAKANGDGVHPGLVKAVLASSVKTAKPLNSVKKIKGKIGQLDEHSGELSLYDCEILP